MIAPVPIQMHQEDIQTEQSRHKLELKEKKNSNQFGVRRDREVPGILRCVDRQEYIVQGGENGKRHIKRGRQEELVWAR